MPKKLAQIKAVAQKEKPIQPFIHQRQIVSAPFAFKEISYFFLCGGYGCGKSFSIVLMIICIAKFYQGYDITVGLCSTTITLLKKTVILDLEKLFKKSLLVACGGGSIAVADTCICAADATDISVDVCVRIVFVIVDGSLNRM